MPKLTTQERGGYTDAVRLTAADLAAIASGGARTIATIPAGGAVELVSLSTSVAFSAAPTGNVSVGLASTPAKYILAAAPGQTVATAGRFNTGSGFTGGATAAIDPVTVDTAVVLTAVAGNYAAQTSGEIVVALRILDPVRFNNA